CPYTTLVRSNECVAAGAGREPASPIQRGVAESAAVEFGAVLLGLVLLLLGVEPVAEFGAEVGAVVEADPATTVPSTDGASAAGAVCLGPVRFAGVIDGSAGPDEVGAGRAEHVGVFADGDAALYAGPAYLVCGLLGL